MKLSPTLPLLSLLTPLTLSTPNTRYSTITIIPVPLSSTVFHYNPTGSSYYPSASSNHPALHRGYHNASANISLSYTLSYPTTSLLPTPLVFAHRSALPLPPLPSCETGEVRCDSGTSFSLCVPGQEGGSREVFMGAVAKGTVCEGGRVRKARGGHCTPVEILKCQGERGFFLCDEGGLVYMGSAANGTTCVDGEIFASGS